MKAAPRIGHHTTVGVSPDPYLFVDSGMPSLQRGSIWMN